MPNPLINQRIFERTRTTALHSNQTMSLQGTINKTLFLLFICVLGAMLAWKNSQMWSPYSLWILLVAFALALISTLKPTLSPFLSPLYAFAEGIILGVFSAAYNAQFNGIISNAIAATILAFFIMLLLYRTKIIKVTRRLMATIFFATVSIAVLYLASWILSLLGINPSYLTSSSPLAIGISIIICLVASFNFLVDFYFIDQMTEGYAVPKYMEWYSALGLLFTLVWLYVEILNLFSQWQRR